MIEETIKRYLTETLQKDIVLEIPQNVPDEFVLIEKINEAEDNKISSCSFMFTCYSTSLYKAATLSLNVKKALNDIIELPQFTKSKIGGERPEITERFKYILTYNFNYYMEE